MYTLGAILKKTRQAQHLSQKSLAKNICAQSMLSAIENDKYLPNTKILINLSKRLGITLDNITLAKNFIISDDQHMNIMLSKLCNNHQYVELKDFLNNTITIESIVTPTQLQAYYYYLGVATLHVDHNFNEAQKYLKIAIASAEEKQQLSVLSRLSIISMSFIAAKQGLPKKAKKLVQQALKDIENITFEENINVIYYLNALINYELHDFETSKMVLNTAILYITQNNSHYMLANSYYLLAKINQAQGNTKLAQITQDKGQFLKKLFKESINQDFM